MPWFANDDDRKLLEAIEDWKRKTADFLCELESCDILGTRADWVEHYGKLSQFSREANRFSHREPRYLTVVIVSAIATRYAALDPKPILQIQEYARQLFSERRLDGIPNYYEVQSILDVAVVTLQAIEHDITARAIGHDPDNPAATGQPADGPQANDVAKQADGPQPPNKFRWQGKTADLAPLPYRLVEWLFRQTNRTAMVDDAVEYVFHGRNEPQSGIDNHKNSANRAFEQAEMPIRVVPSNGYVTLEIDG